MQNLFIAGFFLFTVFYSHTVSAQTFSMVPVGGGYVGDAWMLNISAPGQGSWDVWICSVNPSGVQTCTPAPNLGLPQKIDTAGFWSGSGSFSSADVGTWTEWARLTDPALGNFVETNNVVFLVNPCAANQGQVCNTNSSCSGLFACDGTTCTGGVDCISLGQTCGGGGVVGACGSSTGGSGGGLGVFLGRAKIPNFLQAKSVGEFLRMLIDFLVFLGFIAAGLMIVYAGIVLMTSLGNEERRRKGKNILAWAIAGFVILVLSKAFISVVGNFIGTGSPGTPTVSGFTPSPSPIVLPACQATFFQTCGSSAVSGTAGQCMTSSDCNSLCFDAGGNPVCGVFAYGDSSCVSQCSLGGQNPPPGSAPMVFVDLNINGDGSKSSVGAAATPYYGYYSSPALDDGEYIARLLDASGKTLMMHAFNSPNTVIAEGFDVAGNIDPAKSGHASVAALNTGIVLPAITDATDLVIETAAGVPLATQQIARVVETARQFAKNNNDGADAGFISYARAANGSANIGVVGVDYPSQAEFDADFNAFKNLLFSLEPFQSVQGAFVFNVAPVVFSSAQLGCDTEPLCLGFYKQCNQSLVRKAIHASGQADTIIVFIRSGFGGCGYYDENWGTAIAFVNTRGGAFLAEDARIAVHEFSHSFANLLDEYNNKPSYFIRGRNCEATPGCPQWAGIPNTCTPGCAEAVANGQQHFRPSAFSLLSTLAPQTFSYNDVSKYLLRGRFARLGITGAPAADNKPPTATVDVPKNNDILSGSARLWVVAADNVGVVNVEFYANGALIGTGIQQAAYDRKGFSVDWDTRTVPDGVYNLYAKAFDGTGNAGFSQRIGITVANSGCIPNCAGKCGGSNGCPGGGACINTCSSPQSVCQADAVTCCVPNRGAACIANPPNPCVTGMTTQCDGSCSGGSVVAGTHLECIANSCTAVAHNAGICANQGGCTVAGAVCGVSVAVSTDKNSYTEGEVPQFTVTGAPPNAQILWSSWKNGASTGEVDVFYGHVTDATGSWTALAGAWLAEHGGNPTASWVKQAKIGTAVANAQFTVMRISAAQPSCPQTINGLPAICIAPGRTYAVNGTIRYNPGWPSGLPALGLGAPKLGYIPIGYPFTCSAVGGTNSIAVSNTASGKICESIFTNANTATITGTASYTIAADANAPTGDYLFGLTTNTGATAVEPDFYIRVQ